MHVNMLRPDGLGSAAEAIFTQFGIAINRCQEAEALLALNLQYSMVLAGRFASLEVADAFAQKHGVISMGQLVEKWSPYLGDAHLKTSLARAVSTRNDLAHKFFLQVQSGILVTDAEIESAVVRCRAASEEFAALIVQLERQWHSAAAKLAGSPGAFVPGLQARISAIERGDY